MRNLDEEIGTVSHEEAEQLALCLIDKAFGNPEKPGRRWQASIPVSAQDTDARLMRYIKQQRVREAESLAASRALWAVRVLDAWATPAERKWTMCGEDWWWVDCVDHADKRNPVRRGNGATPDAARISAAETLVAAHPELDPDAPQACPHYETVV